MFSAPSSPAVAGLQAIMVALPLAILGYLVADLFLGRRLSRIACMGLALPGLLSYALVLMLLHIASGGAIFSNLWVVRILTLVTLASLGARAILVGRRSRSDGDASPWLPAIAAAVAFSIWCFPIFAMTPLNFGVDIRLHMGWASQLLNGETTPTSGITGEIPNGYPWLFHAFTSFVTAVTPGARTFTAQAPVQILHIVGAALALFALGLELTRSVRGAWGATIFGTLTGGFGWVIARAPAIVTDAREGAFDYAGDFIPRRSPNMALHDLVPVYPRDIGFVLVVAIALALLAGMRLRNLTLYFAAGTVVGLAGLTGGEAFICGGATAVVMAVSAGPSSRSRRLVAVLAPALALSLIWYGPLIVNYVRFGGFVNSAYPPVELPFVGYLVAFGATLPLALVGLAAARGERGPGILTAAVLLGVPALLLLLAGQIPNLLGEGFSTLGRQHRYWPLLYLGLVAWAAIGFDATLRHLFAHRRWMGPAFVALTLAIAMPTPVLAGIGVVRKLRPPEGFTDAVTGDPENVLNEMAPSVGRRCSVAVIPQLSVATFAYTGYRHVVHDLTGRSPNRARVRWREIYEHVPDDTQRDRDNAILVSGTRPERWRSIADSYGVDIVVAQADAVDGPAFAGYEKDLARFGPRSLVVIRRRPC